MLNIQRQGVLLLQDFSQKDQQQIGQSLLGWQANAESLLQLPSGSVRCLSPPRHRKVQWDPAVLHISPRRVCLQKQVRELKWQNVTSVLNKTADILGQNSELLTKSSEFGEHLLSKESSEGLTPAQLFQRYLSATSRAPTSSRDLSVSNCDYSFHTVILDYMKMGIFFYKALNAAEGVNETNSIIQF